MVVSLKLKVTALRQIYNMVEVQLCPYSLPPPPEEIERARAEAELDESQPPTHDEEEAAAKKLLGPALPPLSTDGDEAMLQKIVRTYKKEMPEFFKALENQATAPLGRMQKIEMLPISQALYLTIDQYRELGSPPLLSILTITVEAGTP